MMIILETERLLLRRFCLADESALRSVFEDPEVMRYGDGAQSTEWIHNWLHECLEAYQKNPDIGAWAVVEKDRALPIGYCGLFYYPDVCGTPEIEIGYRLARAWWGSGYATEAVTAVRDYGFNKLGLPRLIALIDPKNRASVRVAEKAGMHYENEVMFEGYTHPDHVYAINCVTSAR